MPTNGEVLNDIKNKANSADVYTKTQVDSALGGKVDKRTNNTGNSYSNLADGFVGSNAASLPYFKITFPSTLGKYTMYNIELSLAYGYNNQYIGKIILKAYHNGGNNTIYNPFAITTNLPKSVRVYFDDNAEQGIYVYCNTQYSTIKVDNVLMGDAARTLNLSQVTITSVGELPSNVKECTYKRIIDTDDVLTLEEIEASTDLNGKVASAKSVKDISQHIYPEQQFGQYVTRLSRGRSVVKNNILYINAQLHYEDKTSIAYLADAFIIKGYKSLMTFDAVCFNLTDATKFFGLYIESDTQGIHFKFNVNYGNAPLGEYLINIAIPVQKI